MKRIPIVLSVLSSCVLGVSSTWAADPSMGPPPVLQIDREEVKPGKGAAHEKAEAGWPAAFLKANNPTYYIGMTSFSGPSEAWFLIPWESFAAVEKQQRADSDNASLTAETDRLSAIDGELLTRWSVLWATYRADLSYRPDFDVAKMRYFAVTTFRVNPGHDADFAALGEENQRKLRDLLGTALKSSETAHFAFSPKMSYLSKDVAGRDPEFWTPKPKPAATPAKAAGPKKAEPKK